MTQLKALLLLALWGAIFRPAFGSNDSPAAVDRLNRKAWSLRTSDAPEALRLAETALDLAQQMDYPQGIGDSWNYIGLIHRQHGYYEKAKAAFHKSIEVRTTLKDTIGVARTYSNLGTLEYQNDFLDLALANHLKAAGIFERLAIDSSMASVYQNIGNIYESEGNLERAKYYFRQSLGFHQKVGNTLASAKIYQNLAGLYYYEDSLELTTQYAQMAWQTYQELKLWKREADILNILGSVAWARESYGEAEAYFQKALQVYEQYGDQSMRVVDVHWNLGNIFLDNKQGAKAIAALREAQVLLASRGGPNDHLDLAESFADAFQLLGQYDSALHYKNEADYWQDSLYQEEKTEAIAEMQTRYETERKEKELAEEKLKSQKLSSQRRLLLQLLLAVLALTLLLFLFYRHRQRTAAIIAEQKAKIHEQEVEDLLQSQELKVVNAALEGQEVERKRIAKDLHDRLGSLLTTIKWRMDGLLEKEAEAQRQPLYQTRTLLDEAYHEVRQIAHDMNSGVLAKFGLVPALEALRNTLTEEGKLQVELLTNGMSKRLDAPLEILIYRIIQELVSNVLKHAEATQVSIQVHRVAQQLQIVLEDNGRGFAVEKVTAGMGLKNVEARVQGLHGTLEIDSGRGGGTSIFIDLPLTNTSQ